jgi:ABC-type multidrug transport system ATPase subunit
VQPTSASTRRTVLLSSHILAEVEALCDRVTIIRAGQTVESGSLPELRHLTRTTIEAETLDGEHVVEQVEPASCRRCSRGSSRAA